MHPHKPHYDRHAGTDANKEFLHKISRKRIDPPRGRAPASSAADLIDEAFLSYNAGRLREGVPAVRPARCSPTNAPSGCRSRGALTPAGLGMSCLVPLVEAGFIDWIVSTGANLYHDTHFALGMDLHQAAAGPRRPASCARTRSSASTTSSSTTRTCSAPTASTARCAAARRSSRRWARPSSTTSSASTSPSARTQTGRKGKSLLAAAYRCGVPIFTSSPGDSSHRHEPRRAAARRLEARASTRCAT